MCNVCMMTQTFDPQRHAPGEPVFADVNEGSDAAENTSTNYTIEVGDTFYGTISNSSDEDWIRIELVAGTTYEFAQDGISLSDPLVRLYDASGRQLTSNDDGGPGLDSLLEYTATQTGTYYIAADAFSIRTGSYSLSFDQAGPPPPPPGTEATIEELGTFLMEGPDNDPSFFNTSQSNEITVDITGLTADGRQLALWAMDAWEMVADIDFIVQTDGAGNEMITVDDEDSGAFAYFPNRGSTGFGNSGVELNVSDDWLDQNGTTLDSYSFQTYVHEFGHVLGLNHQGDYNFNGQAINYASDAYFTNDSWQLSVMSYFSQTENTSTNASFAYTAGAMMADIWAIQEAYGAPDENSATAGNTTYGEGSDLGNYMDQLFDYVATGDRTDNVGSNLVAFTIYDRDGTDTLEFGFTQQDARMDLRDGQFSDFGSNIGVLGIAQGTVIENAVLGAGNDILIGNTASNTLESGGGSDSVTSDAGDDTIYAGWGHDTVSSGEGNDRVWGGDGRDLIFLNQGDDLFSDNSQGGELGRDTVYTGLGNDTVQGGNGDDVFYGEDGNDVIFARLGNDLIFGGNHFDTISAGEGQDTVYGGNGRDLVFLNQDDDLFYDNAQGEELGQDTVFAGFGNDTIEGGNGNDVFHGEWGDDVIRARLGDDSVFGGDGDDTLDGGDGNDRIFGGDGADVILGGIGNDTIFGGNGQDMLAGGAGADTFVFGLFGTEIAEDRITDFEIGVDRLELSAAFLDGRTAQQIEDQLFDVGAGFVTFSASTGESIYFDGLTSFDGIAASIDII